MVKPGAYASLKTTIQDERCNDNMRREFQACYDSCVTGRPVEELVDTNALQMVKWAKGCSNKTT